MESRFSDSVDREYDFCKLADVRARRKLFVGGVRGKQWGDVAGVITSMQSFLDQHEFVDAAEEYGVVLCSYGSDESCGAWVLRKDREREVVPVPQR